MSIVHPSNLPASVRQLKGAMLFAVWGGEAHRPTRDVDLLGFGSSELPQVVKIFQDICQVSVVPDGLELFPDTMRTIEIREAQEYQGVRVSFEARLENAVIPIQIDIGYGDSVPPTPEDITYPTVLDFSAPKLCAFEAKWPAGTSWRSTVEQA